MLHQHNKECVHSNLKYNIIEDKVYCIDCKKSWGNITIVNPVIPQQPIQPVNPWPHDPWSPYRGPWC